MNGDLDGSILFRSEHNLDISNISVSSTKDGYIWVALHDARIGVLMDVFTAGGWTLKDGWYVEASNNGIEEKLNKIWSYFITAGGSVTFTTTEDRMTFAIFASAGTKL